MFQGSAGLGSLQGAAFIIGGLQLAIVVGQHLGEDIDEVRHEERAILKCKKMGKLLIQIEKVGAGLGELSCKIGLNSG